MRERPPTQIHLIEGWDGRVDIFISRIKFKRVSDQFIGQSGLTMVGKSLTKPYLGQGWNYFASLSESSVSGGIWEEYNRYVYYLFHICKPELDFSKVESVFKDVFRCQTIETTQLMKTQ